MLDELTSYPPQSLALAHLTIGGDDTVLFSPWTETDFRRVLVRNPCPAPLLTQVRRTGLAPWWK